MPRGLGPCQLGLSQLPLSSENLDLLTSGEGCSLEPFKIRSSYLCLCGCAVRLLDRAIAHLCHGLPTDVVTLRQAEGCGSGGNAIVGLPDQRTLSGKLRVQMGDGCGSCSDIGRRIIQGGAKIPVVDAREELPCLYCLVVVHYHVCDIARHLRRDNRGVCLDVGIVGRLNEPSDLPVTVTLHTARHDQRSCNQCGNDAR